MHLSCWLFKQMMSFINIQISESSFSIQINMTHDDISRIQLELVPMIDEIISEWLIILFFSTTPSESPATEDFSSQLSLLQIGKFLMVLGWIAIANQQSSPHNSVTIVICERRISYYLLVDLLVALFLSMFQITTSIKDHGLRNSGNVISH